MTTHTTWTVCRRGFLGLLGVLALGLAARAAPQQVTVSARLSAGVVRLGDVGQVNVTVENADDAEVLALPGVKGLAFGRVGPPRLQQRSGFVNGRIWSETTLSFAIPFRPEAEGDYEIPAIQVAAGGRTFETKPLRVTVVKDIQGADFGYLEVRPSAPRVVEGQPFTVELLFGWGADEEVSFAQLNLPWWDSLPGALEVSEHAIPQENRVDGIVINARQQIAAEQLETRTRNGRRFVTLRLSKTFLPTRSGPLEFPTSFFEFGRRRQVTIFDSRRESHFVQAEPFTVEVVALPSAGQPLDFSGAVGTLAVRASADTRDVRVGDSIKLTVEWTGQGNLEYFRAPDLGALEPFRGFRVYGTTEEKGFGRRKVVYDLSPLSSEVREIPPVPLSVFDPGTSRYGTIASEAIPVRVRALEKSAGLEDEEERFERDLADIDARPPLGVPGAGRGGGQDRFLLAMLVAVPVLGLVARARARAHSGDPAAPLARRRRRARRTLERALGTAGEPAAQQAALLEFLAARTRETPSAWNGRDFGRWAERHAPALPEPVRREADGALAQLEAAVYGGQPPPAKERLVALARTLEEAGL